MSYYEDEAKEREATADGWQAAAAEMIKTVTNSAERHVRTVAAMIDAFDAKKRGADAKRDWMTIEAFVTKYGRSYDWRPLPENIKRGPMQQCFDNAYKLALRRKELTYVEGYATRVIPVYHAWCATKDGIVVDPTWRESKYDDELAYYGVPFATAFVRERRYAQRRTGSVAVLDDWQNKHPVLRTDFVYEIDGVRP